MAAGFSLVLEALRECNKPGVVHNGILDVAYTLNSFAGAIPESWQEYKALVRHWFPGAHQLLAPSHVLGRCIAACPTCCKCRC